MNRSMRQTHDVFRIDYTVRHLFSPWSTVAYNLCEKCLFVALDLSWGYLFSVKERVG